MSALPNLDDEHQHASEKPVELEAEAVSRIGSVLAQKYKLETVIGSGGMAHVYKAKNITIDRTVAIKILRNVHAKNGEVVQRFLREARTANLVRHPNVVDMIDVAQDADGAPFIVQEYLEGETVAEYAQKRGGVVPIVEVIEIIGPVLSALAEAHEMGVVHRDLKPENIFLATRRGKRVPKVLDFGISKVAGAEMTTVGVMMGTPAYMAPELIRSSRDADARSDVWAVGVLIFEVLTGKVPFDGDTIADIFLAIDRSEAARLVEVRPDVPVGLSQIVERCLQHEPNQRYQTATELAADLEAVATELKLTPPGPTPISDPNPSDRRNTAPSQQSQMPVPRETPSRQHTGPAQRAPSNVSNVRPVEQPRHPDQLGPVEQTPKLLIAVVIISLLIAATLVTISLTRF